MDKYDVSTRIVPGQKAFSLFTRRSNHRPIHGFRLKQNGNRFNQHYLLYADGTRFSDAEHETQSRPVYVASPDQAYTETVQGYDE